MPLIPFCTKDACIFFDSFLCFCDKETDTNLPIFSCRYEIRRSLQGVWLLRAHWGCEACFWSRFVDSEFLCSMLWVLVKRFEPLSKVFQLQRSVIQCCILFWKWQRKPTAMILYFEQIQNGILVIYFLFCVNRWREGWHQCQCLCRH